MRDIRHLISSSDRKYIRGHTKLLKPGEMLDIDPVNGKYGGGAPSVGTVVIIGIAVLAVGVTAYLLTSNK